MTSGKTWDYLTNIIQKDGIVHLTLIDPDPIKQTPKEAAKIAGLAAKAGSDAIMIGGSTAQGILDETILEIKKETDIPIILFPGNVNGVSKYADAIFFMSLLNSTNPYFISGAQAFSSFETKMYKLEPIGMAYLIVEPGGTAGYMGDAKPIPRNKPGIAAAYSLAAQFMGFKVVYLEAGSGVDKAVPLDMIKFVKKNLDIPLIVGGGIETVEQVISVVKAGADLIVQGSFVEKTVLKEGSEKLKEIILTMKKTAKERKQK